MFDVYFQNIRAALWNNGEGLVVSEEEAKLHMVQGTGTLVFPHVASMTPQMKMVCMRNMQQQVKLQYILTQAWTALTKAGIQPVLMKGAGLAALYPSPEQRTWGDIDLFVGKDQYHPACAIMRETFPNALKFDEELDHYKHYNLIADGISIEIHRVSIGFQHPIDAARYAKMELAGVKNACELEIGDLRLKIFEPTFNALFVMLHSWEHMMTQGANIRQLMDLTLLLHHYKDRIDRKRLHTWLKVLHALDVWNLYMYMAVKYLGLDGEWLEVRGDGHGLASSEAVRGERLMNDLMAGRMVAPKEEAKAYSNRLARKWHTMQGRLANARRIGQYSPAYARHMQAETLMHGALRLFAKDRHWE